MAQQRAREWWSALLSTPGSSDDAANGVAKMSGDGVTGPCLNPRLPRREPAFVDEEVDGEDSGGGGGSSSGGEQQQCISLRDTSSAASPNQVFYNTKVDEKTTGPSAVAHLGNPIAHPSG
jgi:hypothetical protein